VSTTGMPRIKALAAVRNAALEPLWDGKWDGKVSGGDPRSGREEGGWPATHVVFMNDVFACAGDVIRLLYHDVDMACGFDAYSTRPRVNRFMVSCSGFSCLRGGAVWMLLLLLLQRRGQWCRPSEIGPCKLGAREVSGWRVLVHPCMMPQGLPYEYTHKTQHWGWSVAWGYRGDHVYSHWSSNPPSCQLLSQATA